jgi:hypothetical protein
VPYPGEQRPTAAQPQGRRKGKKQRAAGPDDE